MVARLALVAAAVVARDPRHHLLRVAGRDVVEKAPGRRARLSRQA
jgi:hypothetical protein